jgi:sigma-B regulation protein RsbU (phosphoserine phosphatase)
MVTAKEVGGDFYDFFLVGKDRIGFVIGDVSGKGVPAAMLMAVSRTLLRSTAMTGIPPDACLRLVNNTIAEDSAAGMFVTVFYGVMDTLDGTLQYCSAGHNPAYVLSPTIGVKQLENVGGMVVGVMPDFEYESKTVVLRPGEAVFLYTDGVTEAVNGNEDQFEDKGLEETLGRLRELPVTEIVDKVVEEVRNFAEGVPQADDITCLAVRYVG